MVAKSRDSIDAIANTEHESGPKKFTLQRLRPDWSLPREQGQPGPARTYLLTNHAPGVATARAAMWSRPDYDSQFGMTEALCRRLLDDAVAAGEQPIASQAWGALPRSFRGCPVKNNDVRSFDREHDVIVRCELHVIDQLLHLDPRSATPLSWRIRR
jgi:hypothetical protein